jgi:hypothetical protein
MRKHSKVELSVDFTELMTKSFIFNSQVGVLNVKRCKNYIFILNIMNDFIYIKEICLIKIPEGNTKQDILDLYEKLPKTEFIDLLEQNITKIDNLYII